MNELWLVEDRETAPVNDKRSRLASGALAGLIGGLAMAVLLMAASAVEGQGFTFPMMQIAAVIFGVEALVGGIGVLITGLLIHLATAAVLGIGYGFLIPRYTPPRSAFFLGVFCSILEWGFATYFVLPSVNPVLSSRIALLPEAWFAGHLIYGSALVATPYLLKAFAKEEETKPHPREYRFDQAA